MGSAIRRGTTPTNTFTTDIDLTTVKVLYVTYKQDCNTVIEKQKKDVEITPESIIVHLSQAETLRFKQDKPVEVQIRAKFYDGNAVASNIIKTSVQRILKDGEI